MKYKLQTHYKKLLSDTLTPLNIYLKLRDVFAGSILLESSDYHGQENSLSMICCEPMASFKVKKNIVELKFPDGRVSQEELVGKLLTEKLDEFRGLFKAENNSSKNGFS